MKTLVVLAVITGLILWYALQGRDWLKTKLWAQGFFAFIEPVEIFLFRKSETILFARLKMLTGLLLMVLSQIGTIDLTPFMPFVPDQWEPYVRAVFNLLPLIITAVGWMDESLRKSTTKPIELVAVPDKVVAETPKIAEAVAMADATKIEAVAVIEEAKAA
jgi:hypothetical protein